MGFSKITENTYLFFIKKFNLDKKKHRCLFIGADVGRKSGLHGTKFRYPSYVQDIMGDIFSLGFGPFRLVFVLSNKIYYVF